MAFPLGRKIDLNFPRGCPSADANLWPKLENSLLISVFSLPIFIKRAVRKGFAFSAGSRLENGLCQLSIRPIKYFYSIFAVSRPMAMAFLTVISRPCIPGST